MPWIPRGLRNGFVTTRYPHHADDYGTAFRGAVTVTINGGSSDELERAANACPTNAITAPGGEPRLDRGACVLCGRCVAISPNIFQFSPTVEVSTLSRRGLVTPYVEESDDSLEVMRAELYRRVKVLRRSIHVRHVDAGSDGSDEWEVAALTNPVYDVQRLGIFFTASPRHADLLLVTGVGAVGMIAPLVRTYDAMPHPKVVVAVGVDAASGGLVGTNYASRGDVAATVPVDVYVPGSPATPFGILHGLLTAVDLLGARTLTVRSPRSDS